MTKKLKNHLLLSLLLPLAFAQRLNAEEFEKFDAPKNTPESTSLEDSKATFRGIKVELIPTYYRYTEPNFMSLRGINYRIAGDYVFFLTKESNWLMKINLSSAFGEMDYKSFRTGSSNNEKNYINQLKVDMGRTTMLASKPLMYFWGLGYRNLFNDSRGVTTTGAKGYRRSSQYLFLNGGVDWLLDLSANWNFHVNPEVSILLLGIQKSYLHDANPGNSNFTNHQSVGADFLIHPTFEYRKHLLLGVYGDVWWLDQSDHAAISGGGYLVEPENNTIELGISAGYKF